MTSDPHDLSTNASRWVIVREGTDHGPDTQFLSESQEWGPIDTAIVFDTEQAADNGAQTMCPPFMPGHAAPAPFSDAEIT